MQSFNFGVQGVTGKTGRFLPTVIEEFPDFTISAIRSRQESGKAFIEKFRTQKIDCWIDFSTPESALSLCEDACVLGTPVLIATTGLSSDQHHRLHECAKKIPILIAPNTSLGVFVLRELTILAESFLHDAAWDIEVLEAHHNKKKDAPSGTANLLIDSLQKGRPELGSTFDRSKENSERASSELGVSVIRGGDIVGEHTVYFIGNGERIELTHRAWDRRIFARGALRLAKMLVGKSPGIYQLNRAFFGL